MTVPLDNASADVIMPQMLTREPTVVELPLPPALLQNDQQVSRLLIGYLI